MELKQQAQEFKVILGYLVSQGHYGLNKILAH